MLNLHHGNDMSALRAHAAALMRDAPLRPFLAEQIVVPNIGMGKWFRQGIAETLGIAAQLDEYLPATFIAQLASRVLGEADAAVRDAYRKDVIGIRLMRLLPMLLDAPEFTPVRGYLSGEHPQQRCLALCRRIAALFDQYLVYRPDWLLAWEAGRAADDCPDQDQAWQARLWRALKDDIQQQHPRANHGAQRIHRLITGLATCDTALLPTRVIGFGLGSLPPLFLRVFNALGERVDVHLFQFNPCQEFWGDIVDERTRAQWMVQSPARAEHAETGNALLASWGKLGRDGLQLLLEMTEAELHPHFVSPSRTTVLGAVQQDILTMASPARQRVLADGDTSIVFAESYSRLREVEALHDHLLDRFEALPGLRPRDIVVMAPDIGPYAPHIDAVFGQLQGDLRYVPFTIADRQAGDASPVMRAFLHLLELPSRRFLASELVGLLGVSAIARRFGFDATSVEEVRGWVRESGIRRGLDPDGAEIVGPNTWRSGIERMLLGMAFDSDSGYAAPPSLDVGGNDAYVRLGRLVDFVDCVAAAAGRVQTPCPVVVWCERIDWLLENFFAAAETDTEIAELRALMQSIAADFAAAGYVDPITREVLIELLNEQLAQREGSHPLLRGGVNFCQMTPLRSIPFRVVCLLGMNADAYPRQGNPPGFDLIARAPRLGDRSRRNDDRYLFLEMVLAARDNLYISHVARDERGNTPCEAANPVLELRDYIDKHWTGNVAATVRLTRSHRLKPFHADYFNRDGSLFSYRAEWLPAAAARQSASVFCAEALPVQILPPPTLAGLLGFYRNPSRAFFTTRLGVYFDEVDGGLEDCEPLAIGTLQRYGLDQRLLAAATVGGDLDQLSQRLIASGELPPGFSGSSALQERREQLAPLLQRVSEWASLPLRSVEFALDVGGQTLSGVLGDLRDGRLRLAVPIAGAHGAAFLSFWLRHLCACAADLIDGPSELHDVGQSHQLPRITAGHARALLEPLLELHAAGMRRPLPLFPKSAWIWVKARAGGKDPAQALRTAQNTYRGGFNVRGECEDPYIARAFADLDPLDEEFQQMADRVFTPILQTLAAAPS